MSINSRKYNNVIFYAYTEITLIFTRNVNVEHTVDMLELSGMFALQCILAKFYQLAVKNCTMQDTRFVMYFNRENITFQTWMQITARYKMQRAKI